MEFEINTTDEMFALLCECAAELEERNDRDWSLTDDSRALASKLRAVISARHAFAQALKLRSTGEAHRDRLVAARLDVNAAQ